MSTRPSSGYLEPFLQAVQAGRLLCPRCATCNTALDYAQRICRCGEMQMQWTQASGRGTVRALTLYHQVYSPAFTPPYAVVKVQLEEGAHLTACVPHRQVSLVVGTSVQLTLTPDGQLTARPLEPTA